MGFIDYHGNKENRYEEVVEYARFQQEEDQKKRQDAKINKWLNEILGVSKYSDLTINDTIKYVMIKYHNLCNVKDNLFLNASEITSSHINATTLWNDFSLYIIDRHLEPFYLDKDKQITFFNTISKKVFRLEDCISAEEHYLCLSDNIKYRQYFESCFDVTREKLFWKWLGKVSSNNKKELNVFIDLYEQLIVLMEYYLFLALRPDNNEWMLRIEVDKQILEKIRNDYLNNRLKEPIYDKLINPLSNSLEETFATSSTIYSLDRNRFEDYLSKKNLLSYADACKLIIACELPDSIANIFLKLVERMHVLYESIDKYKDIYEPDMYVFYDYYIPEALRLTAIFIEYSDTNISDSVLKETEQEVIDTTNQLLNGINDKIDEIFKFASIELKARSKALESIMNQDGYIDQKYKINK